MIRAVVILALLLGLGVPVQAATLDPDTETAIDAAAADWLAKTGAPSASIAVVKDGKIAYVKAYGFARLDPHQPATTEMRYAIDSVSKEFTAAAVLIMAQQGKLKLDDPAGKYLPDLGPAASVTLRQLLTHTSGLRDYWPQDFVPPDMARPTSTDALIQAWARRPLDFPPGTDWQYSNTGFVVAGAIVEKVSGEKLLPFLRRHIFAPLKMNHVTEDDTGPLPASDAGAYTRHGLGPVRPAPKEGAGWLFAATDLAMQPKDLALWDISLLDRSLLAPDSYKTEFGSVHLADGTDKHYGLGLDIETAHGRLRIGHSGGGSGFLAENRIWPDDKTAIVVLTNNDWASPGDLGDRIAYLVLPPKPEEARARAIFAGFQNGMVDRNLFTDGGNFYLTPQVLADLKASLGSLGPVWLIDLDKESRRGGMVTRRWRILCGEKRLQVVERGYPDGKLEQFLVMEAGD
ncbi:MAG TPA: serine hydrolase domain-containing protein [Alphaproteobacteria bacterium]|jgi:CubicO group peptidase (beta-lactamase class C family)|nr:serine hydrolase domain-containing protein [Alphaproteobacteria bacterium]